LNDFPLGFYEFRLTDASSPGGIELELELPPDAPTPTKYYKFGTTPDDPTPHWYDFAYDAHPSSPDYGTGAVIDGADGLIHLYFKTPAAPTTVRARSSTARTD
jgi:hypothetical protein